MTQEGEDWERWTKIRDYTAAQSAKNAPSLPQTRDFRSPSPPDDPSYGSKPKRGRRRKSSATPSLSSAVAQPSGDRETQSLTPESSGSRNDADYLIEKIIGALWQTGTSTMWFLIRWAGYELKDCTWEPQTAIKGEQCDAVELFYDRCGKPDWNLPKILDNEGAEFERLVNAEGKTKPKKKRRS